MIELDVTSYLIGVAFGMISIISAISLLAFIIRDMNRKGDQAQSDKMGWNNKRFKRLKTEISKTLKAAEINE